MADANTHDPTGRTGVRVTTVLQVWGVSYGSPVQLYRGSGLLTFWLVSDRWTRYDYDIKLGFQ